MKDSLGRHEKYAQNLAYTCETTRINLTDINSLSLKQLLEHHSVVCMLASGNSDPVRFKGFTDSSMSENIVRCSGFLDEPSESL
jgi:hypothetical protein